MLLFATAAHPVDIPERAPDGQPWYGAAPYATGYPWPQSQKLRFAHRFSIVQTPNPMPYVKHARCIDVEFLAVLDEYVRGFLSERQAGYGDATLYASENTYIDLIDRGILRGLEYRLFAATDSGNPLDRPVWEGKEAWASQYAFFTGYESCRLYAKDFDTAA